MLKKYLIIKTSEKVGRSGALFFPHIPRGTWCDVCIKTPFFFTKYWYLTLIFYLSIYQYFEYSSEIISVDNNSAEAFIIMANLMLLFWLKSNFLRAYKKCYYNSILYRGKKVTDYRLSGIELSLVIHGTLYYTFKDNNVNLFKYILHCIHIDEMK